LPFDQRSVARQINKEHQIAKLYFEEHLKSSQIAKMMRIGVTQVYRIVDRLKRNAKGLVSKLQLLSHSDR
jgi:DNA-directed RNA polymerase specialized sigma subunit